MYENPQTGEETIRPGHESKLDPGLYVVATPIGNLRDITLRALDTLRSCDLILCEDTRVSRKLLAHYGIRKALKAFHEHSASAIVDEVVGLIRKEKAIALISDAGTPLISDPGFPLIRRLRNEQIHVFVVPGPSALTAALSVSGIPAERVTFSGFLPTKKKARTERIEQLADVPGTLVFYEAPHRIQKTLKELADGLGDRNAVLCRELTKKFEEYREGLLLGLAEDLADQEKVKGEFVIVVGPSDAAPPSHQEVDALLGELLETESVKDAASLASRRLGIARKLAYDRALTLSGRKK